MLNAVIRFSLRYRMLVVVISLTLMAYGSYLATTLPIDSSCRDTSCVRSTVSSPSSLTSTTRVAAARRPYRYAPVAKARMSLTAIPLLRRAEAPDRPDWRRAFRLWVVPERAASDRVNRRAFASVIWHFPVSCKR